jgi:hypothetical protein
MPREDRTKHKRIDPKKDLKLRDEVIVERSKDTTTSAGDAGRVTSSVVSLKLHPLRRNEPRKNAN